MITYSSPEEDLHASSVVMVAGMVQSAPAPRVQVVNRLLVACSRLNEPQDRPPKGVGFARNSIAHDRS